MKITVECWKCEGDGYIPITKDIGKTCSVCCGEGKITAKVLEIIGDENED